MNRCENLNKFCNVCGKFIIRQSRRNVSQETAELYYVYFGERIILDQHWAPSMICTSCDSHLHDWCKGKKDQMPFGNPMIWMDSQQHNESECYACLNYIVGTNRKKTGSMIYKETRYVQLPIAHSSAIPVPTRPKTSTTEEDVPPSFESAGESGVSEYVPSHLSGQCNHIEVTQNRFDILVRRLKLSQRQSIILAQDLKRVNILAADVRIFAAIGRHRRFTQFFTSIEHNSFAYCTDIRGLVTVLHGEYNPADWRLFIDSSKSSLKAVLLHITNSKNSVPVALSTNTKETYASLKKIIDRINYNDHMWKICADLKVIALLKGMQTGYTKNMCFMCLWDTRFKGDQYQKDDWPIRGRARLQHNNVIERELVPTEKVLLPPLHIKLGIVKNFIKALDREGEAFNELTRVFPRLSSSKIKEGL